MRKRFTIPVMLSSEEAPIFSQLIQECLCDANRHLRALNKDLIVKYENLQHYQDMLQSPASQQLIHINVQGCIHRSEDMIKTYQGYIEKCQMRIVLLEEIVVKNERFLKGRV